MWVSGMNSALLPTKANNVLNSVDYMASKWKNILMTMWLLPVFFSRVSVFLFEESEERQRLWHGFLDTVMYSKSRRQLVWTVSSQIIGAQ